MEMLSALLALCEGNPSVTDGFPSQRVSDAGFEVFYVNQNKRLCKQSSDMRGHDAHCNVKVMSNGRQGKIRYYGQCKSSFAECICSPIHATPCEIDVNRFAVKALCVVYWRMTQSVNMMAKVNLFDHESCSSGMARIHMWMQLIIEHDDVIKWKHFSRYWPFVRGIHRSPVNSPPKGQWRGALMFSFICVWINRWVRLVIWNAIAHIMASS